MPTDKQRREAERRRLQRQAQRRRERAARNRRFALIGTVTGVLVLVAVIVVVIVGTSGSSGTKTAAGPTASSPASTAPTSNAPGTCTWTKSGKAARPVSQPITTTPPTTGTLREKVVTTRGTLVFTLDRAEAPCASESFESLATQKFFDKTPCHRLVTKGIYVLQCGDPTGTGRGGPGYSFADELSGKETYTRGVLAMANSGPNTNGSQFFIVYRTSPLPPQYTVFGTVSSGLSVVDKVAAAGAKGTSGDGAPKLPISITSVRQDVGTA